jgi:hypothetical protein
MKVIPIDTEQERDQAEEMWRELQNATYRAPGWFVDESRVQEVIDRIERALNAYDRKHPEVNH